MGFAGSKRIISGFVALAFLFLEGAAYGAPEGRGVSIPSPKLIERLLEDPASFQAPLDFVTLKEIHKGSKDTLIIHIQDAHTNFSGQQNLASALDEMMAKYGAYLVFVEGGSRDDTLTPIKKIAPPQVWRRVAKNHLLQGKISGEEYLNLVSDHPMKILGMEDIKLYFESVENYAKLAAKREAILEYLKKIKLVLEKLKRKCYPKEILSYEETVKGQGSRVKGNAGERDFEVQFRELLRLALTRNFELREFPNLQKLQALQEKEKNINFDLANLEQEALLQELIRRGGDEREIKKNSERLKTSRNKKLALFGYFKNTLNSSILKNIALSNYPNLTLYSDYLKEFSAIDLDHLLEEIEKLEHQAYTTRLKTHDARRIRAVDRFLNLLDSAYNVQMTTKDFELFMANERDFETVSYLAFINRRLAELGYFEELVPYKKLLEEGGEALK
ncbi:MAG: hypothetical protein HY593_06280, partial [Candidatus Omnitrophica bacterium]|nr:hypothetical protein [Candidatus Omnitrophota bacterium]